MNLAKLAGRILDVVELSELETRYEEKAYTEGGRRIEGGNAILREMLGGSSRPYPGSGGLCDLVLEDPAGTVWTEVKFAWTWMTYRNPAGPNASYQKHLFGSSGPSALADARTKLPRLMGRPEVGVVGMLLVVLDSTPLPAPPGDVDRYAQLAGLDQAAWHHETRPRRASRVRGYEQIGVHPHLWLRNAHALVGTDRGGGQ